MAKETLIVTITRQQVNGEECYVPACPKDIEVAEVIDALWLVAAGLQRDADKVA